MYFVKFSNRNASSGKITTFKEFDSRVEALHWLFSNGYEADCVPTGGNPYNSNIFWNAGEKISAMGWNC